MKKIIIKEIDEYVMDVKEVTFIYNDLKFVYRHNSSPSYTESILIDLNSDEKKLTNIDLDNLKNYLEENYEILDFESGDEFEIESIQ